MGATTMDYITSRSFVLPKNQKTHSVPSSCLVGRRNSPLGKRVQDCRWRTAPLASPATRAPGRGEVLRFVGC